MLSHLGEPDKYIYTTLYFRLICYLKPPVCRLKCVPQYIILSREKKNRAHFKLLFLFKQKKKTTVQSCITYTEACKAEDSLPHPCVTIGRCIVTKITDWHINSLLINSILKYKQLWSQVGNWFICQIWTFNQKCETAKNYMTIHLSHSSICCRASSQKNIVFLSLTRVLKFVL